MEVTAYFTRHANAEGLLSALAHCMISNGSVGVHPCSQQMYLQDGDLIFTGMLV